jgi:hypothetical protein
MATYAYDVFRPHRERPERLVKIDTVFANYRDAEEMRRALIDHDGYREDITVKLYENGRYVQTAE